MVEKEVNVEANVSDMVQIGNEQNFFHVRYISLVLLTIQNSALILVMHYVRTREGDMFFPACAVVASETVKLFICLLVILYQEKAMYCFWQKLYRDIILEPVDCLKVCVPSLVYVIQNNLLYIALSNLDAVTYQVTYQLKILTTAVFSVVMLGRQLVRLQWLALVILFIGVSIVQVSECREKEVNVSSSIERNSVKGFVAVCASCVLSGFAGVYFEMILKGTKQSIWMRNVQLGFMGIIIGIVIMLAQNGVSVVTDGFFFGFNFAVWIVILLQSFGGLVVAVVVKYADNILKGFATSAAIILSCVLSMYFFGFTISFQFSVGVVLVISAVYMYIYLAPGSDVKPHPRQAPCRTMA